MSSILLGSLAYSGSKSKKKFDLNYDSNIENKMNILERQQVRQNHRKPEFLKQFDDLRLDNIDEPVGINESYKTIEGMNTSLQRNLDFVNGYSSFQETDMHYDVVNKEKFTHNNMVPSTSRRDFSINTDRSQRKLEAFSGIDPMYVAKKEKVPLFQPMPDLTWINGMPTVTNELQKRYLPSSKNNFGNLPFENGVKVRPGLGFENQEGNYSVYRVNPRNVDALRSDINQKVTYENKPLETIKKGEVRGPDPKLTKYKLPDYRETKFSDLLASKAEIEGPKQTGKFTDVKTQRNETENYKPGPAINTNVGSGPDKSKTRFETSKKESYYNDFTHATTDVNNKPVMTNAKSFKNYENQRLTTNYEYEGPVSNAAGGNSGIYTVDYKDIPLTTIRELMINGNTNIGVSTNNDKGTYIFSNDMVLPTTNRQTQSTNKPLLGATSEIKLSKAWDDNDVAKMTLRTELNHNLVLNARGEEKQSRIYNEDKAKITNRQGTNHNLVINAQSQEKQNRVYNEDKAKNTLKQTVLFMAPEKNVRGENELVYTSLQDNAKPTIKQTTIINNRQTGNISNALLAYSRDKEDTAKETIREQTEGTKFIGHATDINHESRYVRDKDEIAKPTIRQQTESTKFIGHASDKNHESIYVRDLDETAKPTIRQQTENNKYVGHINSNNKESTYVRDNEFNAKPTIKQTTVYSTPAGRMNNSNMGNYAKDVNDEARTTIKQTTIDNDYIGGAHGEIDAQISHQAANNMCVDDRREISTYNRTPNGKGDLNGPYLETENVRFNDKKEIFSYVPNPHKPLDHSVMPTTSKETIEKVYSMSKPVIETSTYYVNPYFINTLKNNPLVNDIYHQKNV